MRWGEKVTSIKERCSLAVRGRVKEREVPHARSRMAMGIRTKLSHKTFLKKGSVEDTRKGGLSTSVGVVKVRGLRVARREKKKRAAPKREEREKENLCWGRKGKERIQGESRRLCT